MNSKIESINGCLQVIDTELDNLNFLELANGKEKCTAVSGVSEVKGNKKLCPIWNNINKFQTKFGEKIVFTIDDKCGK